MPGILPEIETAGAVVYRDAAGNPTHPPEVQNAYPPLPAFLSNCELTALPADCDARIEPKQINAIVSELLSFAECLDPDGPWDCSSLKNLCASFTAWGLLHLKFVVVSDTPPQNPQPNQLWWESDTAVMWLWYNDGNSTQWVKVNGTQSGESGDVVRAASETEMIAGVTNEAFGTPFNTMALTGLRVDQIDSGLTPKIVPAINELKGAVDALAASSEFVGSFAADDGSIVWTATSGMTGNALPTPALANKGWYLICDTAGSVPPAGTITGIPNYEKSDWLLSDGVEWTHLPFGPMSTVTASAVIVSPAVAGADDVQEALEALDAKNAEQDAAIASPVVAVTAPELTGNGQVATPITFMGITIAPNSVSALQGNGLSTSGLDLVLIDGGTY